MTYVEFRDASHCIALHCIALVFASWFEKGLPSDEAELNCHSSATLMGQCCC